VDDDSEWYPANDPKYSLIDKALLPKHECLKDTIARTMVLWQNDIVPDLKAGKVVLIAAHGNSLRGLVKHLDGISDDDIVGLNLPTGIPIVYDLDADLKPIPSKDAIAPLTARFCGDQEAARAAMAKVAAQGKAKPA